MLLVDQPSVPTQAGQELDGGDDGASLTPLTRSVYQLILRRGRTAYDELPGLLGASPAELRRNVSELAGLGLVAVDGGWLRAVPHQQAVDALLTEQDRIIRAALRDISGLRRRLSILARERAWLDGESAGTVVAASATEDGSEQHVLQVRARASASLAAMHPGARFSDELLDNSLQRAKDDLARGVRLRVVHQSATLSHPRSAEYLHEVQRLGGLVRLRDSLPFRLIIVDADSAVCGLEWQDGLRETLLLHGAYILSLLSRLFETIWMDSVPLRSVPAAEPARAAVRHPMAAPALTSQHEAIMRYLAEGATDLAIAKSLGITTRTVTRRIGEIYDVLGVQSRFQAGAMAQRMDLV